MAAGVVLARPKDGEGTTGGANNDRRWVGLHDPQARVVRMKSDVPATEIMSSAHVQPIARWGSVRLAARTAARPIAAKAKAA